MVTDAFNRRGQHSKSPGKRGIKLEPDDEPEMITGDLDDYGMAEEVEIPSGIEEEVVTSLLPRRPGRPKKSLTMPPPAKSRKLDGDSSPRRGESGSKGTPKLVHKNLSEVARGRKSTKHDKLI